MRADRPASSTRVGRYGPYSRSRLTGLRTEPPPRDARRGGATASTPPQAGQSTVPQPTSRQAGAPPPPPPIGGPVTRAKVDEPQCGGTQAHLCLGGKRPHQSEVVSGRCGG